MVELQGFLTLYGLIFERFMVSSHFFIEKKVTLLYYSCNKKKKEEGLGLTI